MIFIDIYYTQLMLIDIICRYLLEEDFPGMRIGPEPTTDKWNVVMSGQEEGIVPGNALAVDPKLQFRPLAKVHTINYLNKAQTFLFT